MQRYEFKVVPAPRRGEKARGLRVAEDRFALALSSLMNELGRDGWDYIRADTLPMDERAGFTGTKTSFQNLLVFRRPLSSEAVVAVAAVVVPALGPAEQPAGGAAPALGPATSPDTASPIAAE